MLTHLWNQLDSNVTGIGDTSLNHILSGDGTITDGSTEFYITFFLSLFSASLGLVKCLKNGVARPIGAGGCLDGLLSARHLLAFFACGVCLVVRGGSLGNTTDTAWVGN